MIALQIHHNDVPLCVAGASDLFVLNAIVNAVGTLGTDSVSPHEGEEEDPDLFLSVGGLTSRSKAPNEHLRWLEHTPLAIGDCIKITLLEIDEVDLPVNRIESVRRDPDDERKEFEEAKRTYFRLKDTFETSLADNDK
jgi:hypothetical protein